MTRNSKRLHFSGSDFEGTAFLDAAIEYIRCQLEATGHPAQDDGDIADAYIRLQRQYPLTFPHIFEIYGEDEGHVKDKYDKQRILTHMRHRRVSHTTPAGVQVDVRKWRILNGKVDNFPERLSLAREKYAAGDTAEYIQFLRDFDIFSGDQAQRMLADADRLRQDRFAALSIANPDLCLPEPVTPETIGNDIEQALRAREIAQQEDNDSDDDDNTAQP